MITDIVAMKAWTMEPKDLALIEDDPQFVVAVKRDGYRAFLFVDEDGTVTINNQGRSEWTEHVPHITGTKRPELAGTVLDGEVTGPSGRIESTTSVFGSFADRARQYQAEHGRARLLVFDCLAYKGEDVRERPLRERNALLHQAVESFGLDEVSGEEFVTTGKRAYFDQIVADGGEGVMVKDLESPYSSGRGYGWQKVKPVVTVDAIVTGFTDGYGQFHDTIGAVEYGYWQDGKAVTAGATSGFRKALRYEIGANREKYLGKVMEIKGAEVLAGGVVRFPAFVRFRDDKLPEECGLPVDVMKGV